MAETKKKTTASKEKKTSAKTKKTKKEVVDTGAAQEFVEMMVNTPVSEIETKVDEENNTVIVKAKVENTINEIEVTTTVVEPEQEENSITVDIRENDNNMTFLDVGVLGPSGDDFINEEIDTLNVLDNAMGDEFAEEVNNKIVESVIDEKVTEENVKPQNKFNYVRTAMGVSYD